MKNILYIYLIIIMTSCNSSKIAVVKHNGKFGAINRKGNYIIQPVWDDILLDEPGKPILVKKDSLYGYINRKGNILIPIKFFDGDLFSEGLAKVANNQNKYGYINRNGEIIIDYKYELQAWGDFSNGLADVTLNGRSGYIDINGNIKIPLVFEICYPFKSDLAVVMDTTYELRLIDKKGKLFNYNDKNIGERNILPPKDSYPGSIQTSKGQGRLNDKGDTIVPPIYLVTGNLFDHMYIVQDKNKKWGAFNDKGELKVVPQFDGISHFSEGLASVSINEKYGYVNKKGKIVIGLNFEFAGKFLNGLAYVEKNGKAGFINKKGKYVVPLRFEPYRHTGFD
ncbi:MAG: WG repeat-containing protein [Chitinophagaceae bacterium]|nr:WG repeat-containing protein [Chitinophagaceae bacterium]